MAINIQFRRGTAAEWSSVNPILALAELGLEIDTDLFKIGNGVDNWNDLPYGGLRGFVGSQGEKGEIGNIAVDNVLYVSKSGNDLNDGRSLNTSKLTIRSALQVAKNGTTIFVKSGDYTENNPLLVPEGVAIVGDNLRTVTVRPKNITNDLFWVNNAVYLHQMTFKDYEAPSAAVCFPPDGSAGAIHTSPYVQNCTSITTTGTGMRVDGAHVGGLKSMVVDAYTQYNQGGIGIHMLNRGNTQLVSVFTICCDIGFLCESGGFCSITNANSSFGNYGLKADGVSSILYSANVKQSISSRTFILDGLTSKSNIGDAIKFNGLPGFYTVASATDFTTGSTEIQFPTISFESANFRNARNILLDGKSKIQIDTINYINKVYPDLDYDQFKATRDTGLVIDAVADDLVFGTNYRSVIAGYAYSRRSAENLIRKIKTETVDSLTFAKRQALALLSLNYSKNSEEYLRAEQGFDIVINAILNNSGSGLQENIAQIFGTAGSSDASRVAGSLVDIITDVVVNQQTLPNVVFPTYTWVEETLKEKFTDLQSNKDILKTQVTEWIAENFPILIYDIKTCERDVGLIVDAVAYDLLFGSNFKSIKAGMSYFRAQASLVIAEQKTATIQSFNYLKTLLLDIVAGYELAETRVADNMDTVISIISLGLDSVPEFIIPEPSIADQGFIRSRNLLTANKDFIKAEIIKYIELSYPPFIYNKDKCARDTAIILNGVYYDIALGTNYNSVVNGRSYLRSMASVVITEQKKETVGALRFIKLETQRVLGNEVISVNRNADAFAEIIDIIENGESSADDLVWSDPGISADRRHAREQLQVNKEFIKIELLNWIEDNYSQLEYDQDLCARDVGYIVDAISYDVQYGGNSATVEAAKSYFEGAASVLPESEKIATSEAYKQLAEIVSQIVLETYQDQDILGNPATSIESNIVKDLVTIVADIIEDDSLDNIPDVIYPNLVWVDKHIRLSINNILTNIDQIVESTLDFIDHTYGFVYDEEVCARDVGYIIDALTYDLTYLGNTESITTARAYYSKNNLQIPEKERLATAAAYRYLKSLVELISVNSTVGVLPNINFVSPVNVTSTRENAVDLLQQNKEFIKEEMTKFIDINFQSFVYNDEICSRDIGLIIDAIGFDLVFNSNFKTIKAAMSYYRAQASVVLGPQKLATVKSFEYLKTLLLGIVSENDIAVQRVSESMDIILNSFETGIEGLPEFRLPEPDNYSISFRNAKESIKSNYEFIEAEVIAYISQTYTNLNYDQGLCQRDIRYILDAIIYDITYGGNTETISAARAYYSGAVLQIPEEELLATLDSYDFLRLLLIDIILGNQVTPLQTTVLQVVGNPATLNESNYVNNLLVTLTSIIEDIDVTVELTEPLIDWAPTLLQDLFFDLRSEKSNIQGEVIAWINLNFVNFVYNQEICRRDLELIIDAVSYDILYEGNSQTADAADEYYSGGVLQIPGETLQTVEAFKFVSEIAQQIIVNQQVVPLQEEVVQIINDASASLVEVEKLATLFDIVTNIIENAYSSTITLEESATLVNSGTKTTFHQYSLITASGHTFEWIGAGTNVNTALPYLGGTPVFENQVIEANGGKVYFTGTDQRGDFRIGRDFVINQNTGTISGRTFTKSLFAVMTPYILAIGE
jgi:hypothetical protein